MAKRPKKNLFGFGKKAKKGRPSRFTRKSVPTFEGSTKIKEVAFDQGYQDAKRNYRRNLDTDEIVNYISGQSRVKEWIKKFGPAKIASIYRHDYAQGRKKALIEKKKAVKLDRMVDRAEKMKHAAEIRGRKPVSAGSFMGVRLKKFPQTGQYTTSLDPDSRFDGLQEAKDFIKEEKRKKNPKGKASARARRKPATAKRVSKKAPTQKTAKKNPVVWNGHQGNIKAEVSKPLLGGKYTAKISRGNVVIESKPFATAQGAISFARLRMHERASNPGIADLVPGGDSFMQTVNKTGSAWTKLGKRVKSQLVTRKKRNPIDSSVKAFEEFHGLPTSGVIEIQEIEHRHEWTWLVGLLACIDVKLPNGQEIPLVAPGFSFSDPARIERKKRRKDDYWVFNDRIAPDKIVLLTAVENGKQLILKGGDQSLPLKELGFSERDERDHMVIGEIQEITYRTKKKFEDKGKTDTDFYHEFGKEGSGGVKPQLVYNPISKHMQIVGGRYEVARPEKSLGNVSPGIIG